MSRYDRDCHLKAIHKLLDILNKLNTISTKTWANAHVEKWGLLGKIWQ